jgi:predicted nucleic acid-binding protein
MKYLFDSSAIFRAFKENKIEILTGNFTLELARYELGNILWKDCVLQAKISEQQSKQLASAVKRTLALMDVLEIGGSEEEILETAINHRITFYDASYVYSAKQKELTLVTEDSRLIKKVASATNILTLDEVK